MTENIMRKSDRLIPWYFVFFFVVIAMVDATFVTIAVRTQTGTMTGNTYQRGLDYDQVLAKVAEQNALGWQGEIQFSGKSELHFDLADKSGKVLSGATVQARMLRPVQEGSDFDIALHPDGRGGFQAKIDFPFPGLWDVNIEALWQNHHYYLMKTITVGK